MDLLRGAQEPRDRAGPYHTHNATISACEKGQQWLTATALLREMRRRHTKSDAITYKATIGACEQGEKRRSVWAVVRGVAKR